jgi:hypothetical protein
MGADRVQRGVGTRRGEQPGRDRVPAGAPDRGALRRRGRGYLAGMTTDLAALSCQPCRRWLSKNGDQ